MVLLTPFSQGTHLRSDFEICEFDDDVGAVYGCTVMCVQGVQEWAEDAALRSTSVEGQRR